MTRSTNPLVGWTVDRAAIRTIGQGLQRPECILAEPDGTLWSADARGGVMRIRPDGSQQLVAQTAHRGIDPNDPTSFILGGATLPNGVAINRDGDFVIANFGTVIRGRCIPTSMDSRWARPISCCATRAIGCGSRSPRA
jgi:gluconolactonase